MAGCFVFVEYAFVSDTVDDFNGFLVNCLSSSFVAGFNCFQHFFHSGTECGTQAGVVGALFNRLAGTFAGLCAVCHIEYLLKNKFCKRAILKTDFLVCKLFLYKRAQISRILPKNDSRCNAFGKKMVLLCLISIKIRWILLCVCLRFHYNSLTLRRGVYGVQGFLFIDINHSFIRNLPV